MAENSLWTGFLVSNLIGKGIVVLQIILSIYMVSQIIGKFKEITACNMLLRRFKRDFSSFGPILLYYCRRRPKASRWIEEIYRKTAERIIMIVDPQTRIALANTEVIENVPRVLSAYEVDLVRSTCEHTLDEQINEVDEGMAGIATVVNIEPMLGLLGTVWGVLDAFAVMGKAGSANLATISPSISSALVTTVVGLIIAFPGIAATSYLNRKIRAIDTEMEGFADELMGRVACELQRRDD